MRNPGRVEAAGRENALPASRTAARLPARYPSEVLGDLPERYADRLADPPDLDEVEVLLTGLVCGDVGLRSAQCACHVDLAKSLPLSVGPEELHQCSVLGGVYGIRGGHQPPVRNAESQYR